MTGDHEIPASADELIRLLIDNVQEYAIFVLDQAGNVLTWNAGAQRIKGYGEGEIVGQHFSVFFVEEDVNAGKPERLLADAIAQGRVLDEGWRVRKDGSRFWANVVVTALFDDDQLRGFAKITRDDTDRRTADERSRHLELVLDRERTATELNNAVIKRMYTAGLLLEGVKHLSSDPRIGSQVDQAVEELDRAINDLRTIMFRVDALTSDDDAP